jgi:hypothetical protein
MTQGAILAATTVCSGGLPWLPAREEPNAASAAMAAATMNNEQMRRRKRGNVNTRFEVIEFFVFGSTNRRPATAGRRVDRGLVCFLIPGT